MKNAKWHILFWSLYFSVAYATDLVLDPYTTFVGEIVFFATQNLFLFYSLLYFLRKFSKKTKKDIFISILRLLLIISIFVSIRYIARYYFLTKYLNKVFGEMPLNEWFVIGIVWICHYSFYAAGFYYFQSSIQKQKDLLKASEEKAAKEQEAAQLEIAGLRAQINPHFLFNTLGYFYSKVYTTQPEVGEGIAALSDIMRSAIRKPGPDGLIPLHEEINNIEQLISIYQLRYNNSVFISFNQEGHAGDLRILPHILNTFVENALKHGELHNEKHPLRINLNIENQNIHFSIHDKKRTGPKELSHGIGMNFIKAHLNSFYKDRCSLTINDEELFYSVSLDILRSDSKVITD